MYASGGGNGDAARKYAIQPGLASARCNLGELEDTRRRRILSSCSLTAQWSNATCTTVKATQLQRISAKARKRPRASETSRVLAEHRGITTSTSTSAVQEEGPGKQRKRRKRREDDDLHVATKHARHNETGESNKSTILEDLLMDLEQDWVEIVTDGLRTVEAGGAGWWTRKDTTDESKPVRRTTQDHREWLKKFLLICAVELDGLQMAEEKSTRRWNQKLMVFVFMLISHLSKEIGVKAFHVITALSGKSPCYLQAKMQANERQC